LPSSKEQRSLDQETIENIETSDGRRPPNQSRKKNKKISIHRGRSKSRSNAVGLEDRARCLE
jgi:hypothetical protein